MSKTIESQITTVQLDKRAAEELIKTIKWVQSLDRNQRQAVLLSLFFNSLEQEAKERKGASGLLMEFMMNVMMIHITVYNINPDAIHSIVHDAFDLALLHTMPPANEKPL